MRLFLTGTPGPGVSLLGELVASLYSLETRSLGHPGELGDATPLPPALLLHFGGHPDPELLRLLPRHGFTLLTVIRHPLDTLLAHFPAPPAADFDTAFLDFAVGPRARDLLSPALAWSCLENTLVLRHEDLVGDPSGTLARLHRRLAPGSPELPPALIAALISRITAPASPAAPTLAPDTLRTFRETHLPQLAIWDSLAPADSTPPPASADLAETRARLALLQQTASTRHYLELKAHRLNQLLYGASAFEHLRRALLTLVGSRRFNQYSSTPRHRPPEDISGYHDLRLGHLRLRFHRAALADNRGTGRVARALLAQFQTLALDPPPAPDSTRRTVHFFAAPHWGPDLFPPRSCVLIHDTLPLLTPGYPETHQARFTARCRTVIRQAARLVTISHTSARDISRFFDVPLEDLLVIPNGVTPLPASADSGPPALPPSPYLVYVGGADTHKNLPILFEALALPPARHVHLVLIGENESCRVLADFFHVSDRVHFLGQLDDSALARVVRHAAALVFPSLHEGFGLPPLEAALLGVPSLCSRRPAMTEFLPHAALFAEPDAPGEWAQRIHALTTSPALRDAVAARALAAAGELSWPRAARAFLAAFHAMP